MLAALVFTALAAGPNAPAAPPIEIAPPPRAVGPMVELAAVPGGYRLSLSRRGVERFQALLDNTDEKQAAGALRELAKQKRAGDAPDEAAAGKLELLAFVAGSQIPALRAELRDKAGPGGAVITVTGLQKNEVPVPENRPRLRRVLEAARGVMPLLPADARAALDGLAAAARTTPLTWRVEPRE